MENAELRTFAAYLHSEVKDRALGNFDGGTFSENAFVEVISEHLAEIGAIADPVTCHFSGKAGAGFVKLAGFGVPEDGERIDLIVAIYGPSEIPATLTTAEVTRTAVQAARAIQFAKRRLHLEMERATDSFGMMERIAEQLDSGVKTARVVLVTNGESAVKELAPIQIGDVTISFGIYDIVRLMRTMSLSQTREVIDINLADMGMPPIPCVAMPQTTDDYESYLAIFPGHTLFQFYENYGPQILEYNVRAFLQASGKVNRGIRDTIRDEPGYFMAYNNGISITADEVRTEGSAEGLRIIGFKGLQIVNGGQTTASIHRARKRDRLDLSLVNVPAKVTRLRPESVDVMVPQISRFANTQNVIQEADFSSNEPFHISIERLSKVVWAPGERTRWFYERSRGQYQTAMSIEGTTPARLAAFRERTPPARRFSKTDLAKFGNSWKRLPHIVSGGTQKNFVAFMRSLRENRGQKWEPDEEYYRDIVAQAILFNAAQRVVRKEGFPAYRINIATYLVAYVSHRTGGKLNLQHIWERQEISADLEALMRNWSHSIDRVIQQSADGRNVTEWCKKEGCWNAIRTLDLPLHDVEPAEWQSGEITDRMAESWGDDEHAAAARCMTVSAEDWFAMHLWGTRTGRLAKWEAGIALTLSGYAGSGWQKIPTIKQAKHGVKIIEKAMPELSLADSEASLTA